VDCVAAVDDVSHEAAAELISRKCSPLKAFLQRMRRVFVCGCVTEYRPLDVAAA
jgi:hypothetical protein